MKLAVRTWPASACSVPEPTMTASAQLRSRPITNPSAVSKPLISPPPDRPDREGYDAIKRLNKVGDHMRPVRAAREGEIAAIEKPREFGQDRDRSRRPF